MNSENFMILAVKEAFKAIKSNQGGPFGSVIVSKGKIIAKAHNTVISSNDPTAHAEINAIRLAGKKLKSFDLSSCELFTTCEPCPMCLAAIYWAKIEKIYFGCSRKDAAKIDFKDKFIYDIFEGKSRKKVKMIHLDRKDCLQPFHEWFVKKDKIKY